MDETEIEKTLLARSLPVHAPPGEGWVAPAYQDLSIANLPATIATLLGIELPGALPALPTEVWQSWATGLRRVVLIIVDGLGYRLLRRRWAAGDGQPLATVASAGRLVPLTSVFPSTTDAALMSLNTGVAPGAHGWLAWEMYLREVGVAANGVLLCPIWSRHRDLLLDWGLKPEALVTAPTLATRLSRAGVRTAALASRVFEGSGFSRMLYRGMQQMWGHYDASDFWVQLHELMRETAGQPAFISAYWGGLDTVGHGYGPGSGQWQAEFRAVSHFFEQELLEHLSAADREGTLLLITADHGQIHIPGEHIVTADEEAELSRHLMVPIVGESRAAFVYPRPGRAQAIRDYLGSAFPGRFEVVSSADALDAGLMGSPACDESYSRAGELLVLARADSALQRSRPRGPLVGRHGGLSPEEMLVPLIGARLEGV
jgi:predicted AlkP superfamily pyrophosphatase or phosphodiesterase